MVIDAGGMTAIPGLIDSHVHVTFGDYTPRQRTVGYLESYLHGGTTTAISASEVHVPGRPRDVEGVKALAVAAQRCFADYRPGGMRVIAGSVILEPGLTDADFRELAQKGVRLAKAGFGAVKTAYDYVPMVADAQGRRPDHHLPHRRLVDPGLGRDHRRSSAEDASARLVPHQWRADRDAGRGLRARDHGNPRSPCRSAPPATCARRCCARGSPTQHGAFDRFIIATDTPTGSGIMPLGMLYTIAHLASLTDMAPERFICAASGSNARVYGLDSGLLAPGKAADIVLIDAPDGGTQDDRARRDQARRYRGDRRGRDRRRAALRRPQPQHAGDHAQGARRGSRVTQDFAAVAHWHARENCGAVAARHAQRQAGMIYQQLINGLMLGASYSLVAIGYTLIFGVLNLLYFAHGEIFMVGAFVGLFLVVYRRRQHLWRAARRDDRLRGARRHLGVRRDPPGAEGPPARAADQHDRAHHRAAESRGLFHRRPAARVSRDDQADALSCRPDHGQLDAALHPRRRGRR